MKIWIEAARPKTLIAAISPVLLVSAWAMAVQVFRWDIFGVTLLAAIAIQIGTNFANDYFDHKKGADTDERLGPRRATHAGLVSPDTMKKAFITMFGIASLLGVYLIGIGGWPIAIIGLCAVAMGIGYTAGPWPLAYIGLGDLFVFLFFGLISAMGTAYLYTGNIPEIAWMIGISCGCLSTAILAVNNLRDRHEDKKTGKKTLAVRFGATFTRFEYTMCLYIGFLSLPIALGLQAKNQWPALALVMIGTILARRLGHRAWRQEGQQLNVLLADTGKYYGLWTLVVSLIIIFI